MSTKREAEKSNSNNNNNNNNDDHSKKQKKPIRIWVDGCFDMMHFGHANALRQVMDIF
jgi:bifunctional ADP-heptose synthase (sugar kinase/adenylyltransferase)